MQEHITLSQSHWEQTLPPSVLDVAGIPSQDNNSPIGDTLQTDHYLVLAAQAGCRVAFNELCELNWLRVYRTIFSITRSAEDAEDGTQDCFLRAFLAIGNFEGRASFTTWLGRIAINSALMILRKRRTRRESMLDHNSRLETDETFDDVRDPALDPEQAYGEYQKRAKLMLAISALPLNLRGVAQVSIMDGCSLRESARRLNISEPAAKARLHRARKRLISTAAWRFRNEAVSKNLAA